MLAWLVVTPTGAAPPLPLEVEAFSIETSEWVEDFSSGVLNDGRFEPQFFAFRPLHWFSPATPTEFSLSPFQEFCGDDITVTGGGLDVAGPAPACSGTYVASALPTGGDAVLRGLFRLPAPFEDADSVGFTVGNLAATQSVSVGWTQLDLFGGTLVRLDSEIGLVAAASAPAPPGATHIELVLELELQGLFVVPTGTYRFCTGVPCVGPLLTLDPNPGDPGAGAMPAWDINGLSLYTASGAGTPSVRTLEELAYQLDVVEDFDDGFFPGSVGYFFALDGVTCGQAADAVELDGVLRILGTNSPCRLFGSPDASTAVSFAPGITTPGDVSTRARYRFKIPNRCEFYGLGVGNGVVPPFDLAFVSLVRGPLPSDPFGTPDALGVGLNSESLKFLGGPSTPTVANAIISTDPDNDPALDDIVAIEFALDAIGGVPIGSFRLCTASGCPVAFTPLAPTSPTAFPDAVGCGVRASDFDPPFGPFAGGVFQSGQPLTPALNAGIIAPEPTGALCTLVPLAVLAYVGTRRRQPRRLSAPSRP